MMISSSQFALPDLTTNKGIQAMIISSFWGYLGVNTILMCYLIFFETREGDMNEVK